MRFLILLIFSSSLFGWEYDKWLKEVENQTDQEAVAWLQGKLREEKAGLPEEDLSFILKEPCRDCFKKETQEIEPKLYVFMSFSVPDGIWLSLSKEMTDYPAVFLVRGLPNDSFQLLARKIAVLKEKGMEASVQINPNLFNQYKIDHVPAFVFCDDIGEDTIRGAVSIGFARRLHSERGK